MVDPKNSSEVIESHVEHYRTLLELSNCQQVEKTVSTYRKALHLLASLAIQEFCLRTQQDLIKVKEITKK